MPTATPATSSAARVDERSRRAPLRPLTSTSPSRTSPSRTSLSRRSRGERTSELLEQAQHCDGAPREAIEDEVIRVNLSVALDLAHRYRGRDLDDADLEQVASLALVKAVRAYQPGRGRDFLSFAVPTIRGELRRHFRDHGWVVRPPRSIQELQAKITAAQGELAQELRRDPRPAEIAERIGAETEAVTEAMGANGCFVPSSLDAPSPHAEQGETTTLGQRLGGVDPGYAAAEARAALAPVVGELTDRERRILELRFVEGRTQAEIGQEIGVTQMQVSRLLKGILSRLRTRLEAA